MSALLMTAAGALLLATALVLHAFALYAIALLLLASLRPPLVGATPSARALPRIAGLIVAHDEERVVMDSVRSLMSQRYAEGQYAVCLVADHCTDRTAEIARSAGAQVIERAEGRAEGKSAAVAFGIEAVARDGAFDAVAIFDADNVADADFLGKVGERLARGERVVQGLVDAKNPGASWVAGSSALGFWALAELAQAPRERLGLSAPLMGTGFAMRLEDAREVLSGSSSLTDDLDLGARLALRRIRVAYEPEARTVDEKPTRLRTAVAQRHRWMQGRWAVARQHLPALLAEALGRSGASLAERARMLDVGAQLVAPSLLFAAVATAALAAGASALDAAMPGIVRIPTSWSLAAAALYYAIPTIGIARHEPPARVWLCYLLQPAYLALSAPLALSGWLARRGGRWARTPKGMR